MRARGPRRGGGAGPYPAGSLSRAVIALAINTGIAPAAWAAEDERTLVTAMHLLAAANDPDHVEPIAQG